MADAVVVYRYDTSPFSKKLDHILLLKGVSHQKVNVANMLPRPEITDFLGVTYRQIPILAIGSDIYCDTSLIASALERRFPSSQGYNSIFPKRKDGGSADTGLIKAFARQFADSLLFMLVIPLLAWDRFPPAFIEDRGRILGPIDVEKVIARRPQALSQLSSHLTLVEEQLSDSRDWLFDTKTPSLADISVHFVLTWLQGFTWLEAFGGVDAILDPATFPKLVEWLARLTAHLNDLEQQQSEVPQLSGEDAAVQLTAAPFEPYNIVGFDEREATRLGLKNGDRVSIARDDHPRNFPTVGKLVALNREEFVIETKGSTGVVRCHFPRIMFTAKVE